MNVKHNRCAAPNCDARVSFGKPGTKDAEFCRAHAPPEYSANRVKEIPSRKERYGKTGVDHQRPQRPARKVGISF
ncbi:MAG: hypothetical protein ACYCOU_03495 [Sulfobacillus sp.]